MSYIYRYTRHTSGNGNDGFSNGDPLVANDLNKIEIALKEHDTAIANTDSTLDHVLSGINIISATQIQTMIAAAETAAAQAAAAAAAEEEQNNDSGNENDDNNSSVVNNDANNGEQEDLNNGG